MANLNAPILTPLNEVVRIGESISVTSLFSVTDLDGDEIVEYGVLDGDSAVESGYFTLDGVQLSAGVFHNVAAEKLADLRYNGGSVVGSETLRFRASDGIFTSNTGKSTAYTVNDNVTRPVMTTRDISRVSHELVRVSSFFSGSDPDGWPAVRMKFRDKNAKSNSGYFVLDGVRQPSDSWFYVRAADYNKLYYYTGTSRTQENLLGRYFDGALWSRVARSKVTTTPNRFRPEVEGLYITKSREETFPISDLFNVSDGDGNTSKEFRFRDITRQADSGYITVNGVVQPSGVWITVPAADIDNTFYTTSAVPRLDGVSITVNDGRFQSAASVGQVAVTALPVVDPSAPFVYDGDESVALIDLIEQSDNGARNEVYRIYDDTSNPFSVRFEMNGNLLNSKQLYEFTAAEMEQVNVVTGPLNDRRLDEIFVQTFNGTNWSEVRALDFRTEPYMEKALANVEDSTIFQQNSWRLWLNGAPNEPLRVTYSFRETPAIPLIELPPGDPMVFTSRFTINERIQVRALMERLEDLYGLDFVEVQDSVTDPVTGALGGRIRIGHGTFSNSYVPNDKNFAQWGGDIYTLEDLKIEQLQVGTFSHANFLQLLGSSLGLRLADSTSQVFNPLLFKPDLPDATNDVRYTAMSNFANPVNVERNSFGVPLLDEDENLIPINTQPSNLGIYDDFNIKSLYGKNKNSSTVGDDVYGSSASTNSLFDLTRKRTGLFDKRFELHDSAFQTSITGDRGGIDTIDVSEMNVSTLIDLTPGSYSSIGEVWNPWTFTLPDDTEVTVDVFTPTQQNVFIGHDTVIENVIGNDTDEVIRGNFADNRLIGAGGNDTISGGAGDDELFGGEGDDTYKWKLSDQNAYIRENFGGGDDTLEISSHWALDDITDDMEFYKSGRDLFIDLTINDDISQGVIQVEDMSFGLSRVEMLTIKYTDGTNVDVDMKSIFDAVTTTPSRIQLTEDTTAFGFIAELA